MASGSCAPGGAVTYRGGMELRHPLSYGKIMRPVSALTRNRQFQARRLPNAQYVNLGCAANTFPGYINVDWWKKPRVHLCWDMTRPLPIANESVEGVYSEHAVEHLTLSDTRALFQRIHGWLRSDGTFRLVVPDAGRYIEQYMDGVADGEGQPPIARVDRIFRGEGHQCAWDFDRAKYELEQAGFVKVTRVNFNEGRDQFMWIDSPRRREESLYVEAVKP